MIDLKPFIDFFSDFFSILFSFLSSMTFSVGVIKVNWLAILFAALVVGFVINYYWKGARS